MLDRTPNGGKSGHACPNCVRPENTCKAQQEGTNPAIEFSSMTVLEGINGLSGSGEVAEQPSADQGASGDQELREPVARDVVEEESREGREVRLPRDPGQPTKQERDEHCVTHLPYRSWCPFCVKGKGDEFRNRLFIMYYLQIFQIL